MLAEADSPQKHQAARELLEGLEPAVRGRPDLALFLGMGFATVKDFPRALNYARRARRADRDHYQAMALEARIHQATGRHRECVESALDSLGLVYFQPVLHYHMGLSLRHLGEETRAEHSFRVAISQMPGLTEAHLELAKIMRLDGRRVNEAGLSQARAQVLIKEAERRSTRRSARRAVSAENGNKPEPMGSPALDIWTGEPPADRSKVITIVAGLPRSGTSMMMQVLHAAGIGPYTDGLRTPDEDNPRGYFEHEQAARLHEGAKWLKEARSKVVKIVAQLLPHLPSNEQYRIVFLHRNLEEVVASQRVMLQRQGRATDPSREDELARVYGGQLVRVQEWLRRAPGVQVLAVNYAEALTQPDSTVARLASFLGEPFDRSRAAKAIEPAMRRQIAEGRIDS